MPGVWLEFWGIAGKTVLQLGPFESEEEAMQACEEACISVPQLVDHMIPMLTQNDGDEPCGSS